MTPGPLRRWVLAARVRTLPAAAVPVAVGATLAGGGVNAGRSLLCLVIALSLQIATNYANDYSDGVRGTDANRVGPFRITASGLVEARVVRNAAVLFFALAAVAGLWLALLSSLWLIPLGALALLAGWFYTGGPKPYGYLGLGELFVLVFFGFAATVGTAYVQHNHIPHGAWWWGLATGAMACAMLEANNLRDIAGDREAGKLTLAARMGRRGGGWLYVLWVAATALGAAYGGAPLIWAVAVVAYIPALQIALSKREGRDLLPLLQASARAQLIVGAAGTLFLAVTR